MGLLRKEAEVSERAKIGFTTIPKNKGNKLLIRKSILLFRNHLNISIDTSILS